MRPESKVEIWTSSTAGTDELRTSPDPLGSRTPAFPRVMSQTFLVLTSLRLVRPRKLDTNFSHVLFAGLASR